MISEAFRRGVCAGCPHHHRIEYQARAIEICNQRRDTALVKTPRERSSIHPQTLDRLDQCPDEARRLKGEVAA